MLSLSTPKLLIGMVLVVPSLGCLQQTPALLVSNNLQENAKSTDGKTSRNQKDADAGKPSSRDVQTGKEADAIKTQFEKLSDSLQKSDFVAAAKYMTKRGLEEYFVIRVLDALTIAEMTSEMPKVLKDYKLDKVNFDALIEGGSYEEAFEKLRRKILSPFANRKELLAAMKLLAEQSSDEADAMFTIAFVGGTFLEAEKSEEGMLCVVKPKISEMEGAAVPPGSMEGIPNFYLKYRKEGNAWKWDGVDEERMAAEMGEFDYGQIETIENPDFTGTAFSGKKIDLKAYRGKVVLIDFWGTWCHPCVEELPKLKSIYKVLNEKGFDIVGIAQDDKSSLKSFFRKKPLPWENVVDGQGKLSQRFNVFAFPTTLLINKEGKHVASNLHGDELVAELSELLDLDEATVDELRGAIGGKVGVDDSDSASNNAPEERRLPIGFSAADANGDSKIEAAEMKRYLSDRLVGVSIPHAKVFKRLDVDGNSMLSEIEFEQRHGILEELVPEFDGGPTLPDPGQGFVFYKNSVTPVDDRGIMGAVTNRTMAAGLEPLVDQLEAIPEAASLSFPTTSKTSATVDQLARATVIIAGDSSFGFFVGGAVVVSSDGLAVTNYHIAEALDECGLLAYTTDGKSHRVKEFLAGSPERDVALIRLGGEQFDYVNIANEVPSMGDDLLLMHHSENRFYTYDRGYVMRYPMVGKNPWLEISADYAPGGSGCGIFNEQNELVGLVSMVMYGDGPSLAEEIPMGDDFGEDFSFGEDEDYAEGEFDEGMDETMLLVKRAVPLTAIRALWKSN